MGDSHNSHSIVIKHGRNVFARKLIGSVGNKKAGLPNGSIANDNTSAEHKVSKIK